MKILLLLTILSIAIEVLGQESKVKFGFYAEAINSQNIVRESKDYFSIVKSRSRFGFGLGASLYLSEGRSISFRLSPGLGYINEVVVFENPGTTEQKRGSIFLKIPTHVLIKLNKNYQLRLITGLTPSVGLLGGNDINNELDFKKFDLTGDIGFGYQINAKAISIRPEIKYSYSFINGLSDEKSMYREAIDKYLRNKFTLTLIITR